MTTAEKPEVGTRPETKGKTFEQELMRLKPWLERILPDHLKPERMLTLALHLTRKTPLLRDCSAESVLQCVIRAGVLGLELGSQAHILPFKNKHTGGYEGVFVPDYRGLVDLTYRTGAVARVEARAVFKADKFAYQLGTSPFIRHEVDEEGDQVEDNVRLFYALCQLKGTDVVFFEVYPKKKIDAIRSRAPARNNGPWANKEDYVPMGEKTAFKQFAPWLPQSPQLRAAIELDNASEGHAVVLPPDMELLTETTGVPMPDLKGKGTEGLKQAVGVAKEEPPARSAEEIEADERSFEQRLAEEDARGERPRGGGKR